MTDGGISASLIPAYRNQLVSTLEFDIGESPNFTSYGLEVRSLSTSAISRLNFGHSLVDDADPASVILDLLTGTFGKLSLPFDLFDLTSFAAASATLLAEGHGYSRAIYQSEDIWSVIKDICRQTDGM